MSWEIAIPLLSIVALAVGTTLRLVWGMGKMATRLEMCVKRNTEKIDEIINNHLAQLEKAIQRLEAKSDNISERLSHLEGKLAAKSKLGGDH